MKGVRTTDDAIGLFQVVEQRRAHDSPIPIFTSDDWDPFEEGLFKVYGILEKPPYKGVGRKPLSVLVPHSDLKYAQVCKKREKNQVVATVQRVVFGNTDDVLETLSTNSESKISTSYVERITLTIRNALARFIRKGMNCSKSLERLSHAIDFFQIWLQLHHASAPLKQSPISDLGLTTRFSEGEGTPGQKKVVAANSRHGGRTYRPYLEP